MDIGHRTYDIGHRTYDIGHMIHKFRKKFILLSPILVSGIKYQESGKQMEGLENFARNLYSFLLSPILISGIRKQTVGLEKISQEIYTPFSSLLSPFSFLLSPLSYSNFNFTTSKNRSTDSSSEKLNCDDNSF